MPAEFAPAVPLLAVAGLVALPYDLAVNDGGGLDFAWRPSQTREDVLADPVAWGTLRHGSEPDDAALVMLSKGDVVRYVPSSSPDDLVFAAGPTWGRLSFSRIPMARLYSSDPLRIDAIVSLPPGYRTPAQNESDIDILGSWNRAGDTLTYSVTVPPTMAVWA
jgi:hypothetical protein